VQDRWGWELPGGLIDEGEEPAETAARELEEQTGYRAGRVEHFITFQPMVGMVDSEHVVFVGKDPERIGEPTETTEVERMEWVPLASVPGLIAAGEIWNSGTLVALLRLLAARVRLLAAGPRPVERAYRFPERVRRSCRRSWRAGRPRRGLLTIGDARRVTHLLQQEEQPFRHNEITIAVEAVTGMDGGLHHDLGPNQIEDVPPAVG
jgi:hypothetical protein